MAEPVTIADASEVLIRAIMAEIRAMAAYDAAPPEERDAAFAVWQEAHRQEAFARRILRELVLAGE